MFLEDYWGTLASFLNSLQGAWPKERHLSPFLSFGQWCLILPQGLGTCCLNHTSLSLFLLDLFHPSRTQLEPGAFLICQEYLSMCNDHSLSITLLESGLHEALYITLFESGLHEALFITLLESGLHEVGIGFGLGWGEWGRVVQIQGQILSLFKILIFCSSWLFFFFASILIFLNIASWYHLSWLLRFFTTAPP